MEIPRSKIRNFDLGFYLLRTGAIIYKTNMAVPADDRDVVQWSNRFGSASEEDMSDILTDLNAKNTENSTKYAVKLVRDYCLAKNSDVDFENLATPQLNLFLKEFYVNLRQTNGELYNKSSFIVIRQSINRFLKHPPVNRAVDIIKDSAFDGANNVFSSMCKRMRPDGKGKINHKPSIQKGDMQKLYNDPYVLNIDTPTGLLYKVFFETVLYFCRRGQENLRSMSPKDFQLRTDDSGKPCVCKVSSELTKIHQGIRNEQYEAEGGRMYETKTQMCPVQSFLKYIRKRNHICDAFWQRPRDS